MKRFFVLCFLLAAIGASAKKVKFQVNMEAWLVDSAGIHVTGDFQDEAGFTADWDPGTTAMFQDASDTNVYWAVVDIPAFRVYEFKYVNGIFGYQQEFVPFESRVNYNFIDNRWIYIDSLANDTQTIAPVRFSGNAPDGKNLVRFYVDMSNETVSGNGVHVATSMNSWSTTAARMYTFDGDVWEYIGYADSGQSVAREYKFLNGNTSGNYELLAGWCANTNGNREVIAPRDTMLPTICYTFCAACSTVGVQESTLGAFSMMPNPAVDHVEIVFSSAEERIVSVIDHSGREVMFTQTSSSNLSLSTEDFAAGVYYVRTMDSSGKADVQKLVIE